jgi:hypothetical protein
MLHDISWLSSNTPAGAEAAVQWVMRQYQTLHLPDKRLEERCRHIAMDITENPSGSLNQASDNWGQAKAAYRFLENSRLTAKTSKPLSATPPPRLAPLSGPSSPYRTPPP